MEYFHRFFCFYYSQWKNINAILWILSFTWKVIWSCISIILCNGLILPSQNLTIIRNICQIIRAFTADIYYIECRMKEFQAWLEHSVGFIQKVACQIKLEMDSIYRNWLAYIDLSFCFPWLLSFVYFDKETRKDYDQKVLIFPFNFFFPFISSPF